VLPAFPIRGGGFQTAGGGGGCGSTDLDLLDNWPGKKRH